jgi:hypothetical protein
LCVNDESIQLSAAIRVMYRALRDTSPRPIPKHAPPTVAKFALGTDVAVKCDGLDAKFGGKHGYRGIVACHGGLSQPDLRLGQRQFATAAAASGTRGGKACDGALADQFAFELGQGCEDAKDQATAGVVVSSAGICY